MTAQEYLDLLITTSLEDGFPAEEAAVKMCRYRAPDGKKCAVGLLIPDEKYQPELETVGPSGLVQRGIIEVPTGLNELKLGKVQHIHDSCALTARTEGYWDHKRFVQYLQDSEVFRGCVFPNSTQNSTQG